MHRIDLRVYVARVCVLSLSALIGTISFAATEAISSAGPHFGSFGIDLSAQDRSVKPGNDFFRYADGAKPIPADMVEERADGKFHDIKHPNLGIQQPSQPNFSGQVVVLMNGGSFSTTCEFLSNLHDRKRAIFVGEEAGGGYFGNSAAAIEKRLRRLITQQQDQGGRLKAAKKSLEAARRRRTASPR